MGNSSSSDLEAEEISVYVKNLIDLMGSFKGSTKTFTTVPDSETKVSQNDFIWAAYQSIETLTEQYPKKYPGLIELVYFLTYSNYQFCTGRVDYTNNNNLSLLKTESGIYRVFDDKTKKHTNEFKKFGAEFLKRIRNTPCPFTTLFFGISNIQGDPDKHQSHQNIIIIFKDEEKIHLSVYDPHGSQYYSEIQKAADNFLIQLRDLYPDIFVISPRVTVSCPIGLQAYANDDFGYCVVFSLFWLYCVLYISSKSNNGLNLNNIHFVEKFMIFYAKKPKKLFNMTIKFSIYLINSYIELLTKKGNPQFNIQFAKLIKYNIKDEADIKELSHKRVSIGTETERKKYLKKASISGTLKSTRKKDGDICKHNDDCMSDICNDQKCISYSDAYKTKKRKI